MSLANTPKVGDKVFDRGVQFATVAHVIGPSDPVALGMAGGWDVLLHGCSCTDKAIVVIYRHPQWIRL